MKHFAYPLVMWLLLLPFVIYAIFPAVKKMYGDALRVPFLADLQRLRDENARTIFSRNKNFKLSLKSICLLLSWLFIVLALSRPQLVGDPHKLKQEGRDILLVVDISTSMQMEDFYYGSQTVRRIDAVKNVVEEFIKKRVDDRIGLVLFGTRAYLQAPLTFDKQSVLEILQAMEPGMAGNSTSLGDAIGIALKSLAESKEDSANKMLILLTDGENNDGSLSFEQAAKLAKDEKVKVYSIGVGTSDGGLFSMLGGGYDATGLKALASITNGKYYNAYDTQSLKNIYNEINKLEPLKKDGNFVEEKTDLFYIPALVALLFLLAFVILLKRELA